MDWQSAAAIALGAVCAGWVVRHLLKPLVRRKAITRKAPPADSKQLYDCEEPLLQIAPARPNREDQ